MEIRFKLKESNSKDKIIADVLREEYNHNEFIKNLIYKLAVGKYRIVTEDGGIVPIFEGLVESKGTSTIIVSKANKLIENKEISSDLEENTEVEEEMDIVVDNDIMDFF